MKAAVVTGNCTVAVKEMPEPQITKPSEIKIKVICGAICNTTDNKVYFTDTPEDNWPNMPFPFIIGHECVGRVVEKGTQVNEVNIGDRVVYWTVNGKAFADYLILDTLASAVVSIGDSVPNNTAAIMEMVIGAARLLFTPNGEKLIKRGDLVVIIGLGPAGLIYHSLARMLEAEKICAVGRRKYRLEKALEMGATAAVDSDEKGYIEQTLNALGGKPDIIIDATGGDTVEDIIALAKPDTRIIAYGIPPFDWKDKEPLLIAAGLKPPQGMGLSSAKAAASHCVNWVESGKSNLEKVISHKLPLEQVGRGLDMCRLEKDSTLKIVISINE